MAKLPVTLALDSSASYCSAIILDEEAKVLAAKSLPMERGHAEAIIPLVDDVFELSGIPNQAIERVGFCSGPGSFAGLRVAQAAAKGYAIAWQAELIGISSFDCFGYKQPKGAIIALDGRRSEVFLKQNCKGAHAQRIALDALDEHRSFFETSTSIIGPFATQIAEALGKPELAQGANLGALEIGILGSLVQTAAPSECPPNLVYLRDADAKIGSGFAVQRA